MNMEYIHEETGSHWVKAKEMVPVKEKRKQKVKASGEGG